MKRKIVAMVLVVALVFGLMASLTTSAQGEGENIARQGTISVPHSNGGVPANINNGVISKSSSPSTTWNTWGARQGTAANPFFVTLTWSEPYLITGTSVLWWIYTDSGVQWPRSASVQYMDMLTNTWKTIDNIGVEGKGKVNAGSGWVFNDIWNDLTFDTPVVTNQLRLSVVANKNSGTAPGFGINEWEVYGAINPAETDLVLMELDLSELVKDVKLPAKGATKNSTITWESSNPAILSNEGVVTRPEIGEPDATGTITATAVNGEYTAMRVFDFSILAKKTAVDTVEHDLEAINLGDLSKVLKNLDLPTVGEWGSKITWNTGGSKNLWTDGSVIRPTVGSEDAVVTLTVTVEYEDETRTKDYTVTIPAFAESKTIASAETPEIECPVGTVPKLPNDIKVTYTDGTEELRRIKWNNESAAAQTAQAGYAVGHEYTVSGNVTGDTIGANGFAVSANVTVVEEAKAVPSTEPIANALPLNSVTITGDNRLTQNRDAAVTFLKNVSVETMLYNYRDTFGQSTEGAAAPTGWDRVNCKLKGHGTGHYLSAMAQAYASTGDETLLANMKTMVDEMRRLQEMTFVPHPTEDRYVEARDFAPTDADVTNMSGYMADWGKDPATFGYGYINAIPPEHPILVERYAAYNDTGNGVWAPYYSIHKQLAGLIDIYNYTGYEKALTVAKDLGLWIWNRLHYRTYVGSSSDRSKPGNLTVMWSLYIAGEFGGINESMARLYDMTKDERFLEGAKFFDNNTFFEPLAVNKDSIRTLHANQHIPQITGALWTFKGSADPDYYNTVENFWDYNLGRYSYSIGGVGQGEMYRQPYAQATNIAASNCETCCAYNLLKLTKDLNGYNPDDAKYMDYYERLLYNQVVGSISAGSTRNAITYHYPIGPSQSKGFDGAGTVSSTCCTGTGSENHVKYQDGAYYVSADNKTFYVGLYMPTTANWAAKGVTITQDCLFPAETSTIKVTEGTGEFEIKLRVPYWATKDFDIKLNGTSIASSYEPSTYVSTGVRNWSASDTLVVTMPFEAHIDATPDKLNGNILGSVMYGPLVMAASTGSDSATTLNLDTYLKDESLIKLNGASDVSGTKNLYTMTVNGLTFRPHYYVTNSFSTYFYINYQGDGSAEFKTELYDAIQDAKSFDDERFTEDSRAELQSVLAAAIETYQDNSASQEDISAAIEVLEEGIGQLVSVGPLDTAALQAALSAAKSKAKADYTWDTFEALEKAIKTAEALLTNPETTQGAVEVQVRTLNKAVNSLILASDVNKAVLATALSDAATKVQDEWTVKSWKVLQTAVTAGTAVYNNTNRNASQKDVDDAAQAINAAINRLRPYFLCDEYEDLEDLVSQAQNLPFPAGAYTPESYADLQEAIEFGIMVIDYCANGSGTWDQKDTAVAFLEDTLAGLVRVPYRTEINLAKKITYTGSGNNAVFTNGSISDSGTGYNSWNSLTSVNDGFIPALSNSANNQAWGTWGGNYTTPIWIEYNFGAKYEINSTSVFWCDNDTSGTSGDGGMKVPKSWSLQYWDDATESWKTVTLLAGEKFGNEIDVLNDVRFETIVTDRVRIYLPESYDSTERGGPGRPGICEWQVWGNGVNISTKSSMEIEANTLPTEDSDVYNPSFNVSSLEEETLSLIVASYDEKGALVDRAVKTITIEADVMTTLQASIPNVEGRTYRFFIWDDAFKPLTSVTSTADLNA